MWASRIILGFLEKSNYIYNITSIGLPIIRQHHLLILSNFLQVLKRRFKMHYFYTQFMYDEEVYYTTSLGSGL